MIKNVSPKLHGFSYRTGSLEESILDLSISELDEQYKSFGSEYNKDFIGNHSYYVAEKSVVELLDNCIDDTLGKSNLSASDIDGLVLVSSDLSTLYKCNDFFKIMLEDKGLYNAKPIGFSFQECVTLFTALDTTSNKIISEELNNVLFLVLDFPADRVKSYALFSDSVSSFIMSKNHKGLTLSVSHLSYNLAGTMGKDDNKERLMHAQQSLEYVLKKQGVKLKDVSKVFSTNFYNGLARFNQMMLGISKKQFYIDSVKDVSHCGNSDPIVNLIHYFEHNNIDKSEDNIYVLQAYANGFCGHALLTG